jgi:hypothetical protein
MRVTQVSEQRFRPAAMVQNSRSRGLPADEGDARDSQESFPPSFSWLRAGPSPALPGADFELNCEGRGGGRVGKRDFPGAIARVGPQELVPG